jgi:hypothetical protein
MAASEHAKVARLPVRSLEAAGGDALQAVIAAVESVG